MKYSHTALSVNNLEESQKFYEDIFGLKFKTEAERPELKVKIIFLEDDSGNSIELFKHENPKPLKEDLMDFSNVGYKHISFIVENIEEVIEKAKKYGSKVIWPPTKGITIKRLAFISDPSGLPIEIIEL